MFRKLLLTAALLTSTAANAEWKEATSKHFVVYSEGSDAELKDAVTQLEKYDFIVRWASSITKPSSPQKLKIFLMEDMRAVQDTMGIPGVRGVAGYYTATSRGPIAVGFRNRAGRLDEDNLDWRHVLFHEYAHHLTNQYFPAAYPSWYQEGFADYYGTTKILDNDVVEIGHPVEGRYLAFKGNNWMSLDKMLTAKSYADVGRNIGLLYSQGWLLVHYLGNNEERKGQLQQYLNLINSGKSYDEAMNTAFGEGAEALNAELKKYSNQNRVSALRIPFKPIDVGSIELRTLTPAEDALIEYDIALGRGLFIKDAPEFVKDVREVAAKHPNSAYAQAMLVEAQRAAGDNAAAAAAADRWLAIQPDAPRALMHKGEIQIDSLIAARSADEAAWAAARQLLVDAHKAAPNDPAILEAYYDSYTAQGVLPPAGAQNALYRAFDIVPQSPQIRQKLAIDFEKRDMIEDAIDIIKPAAFELHADKDEDESEKDRKKREELEAKWRAFGDTKFDETPLEMLTRLEKKLAETGGGAAATTAAVTQ